MLSCLLLFTLLLSSFPMLSLTATAESTAAVILDFEEDAIGKEPRGYSALGVTGSYVTDTHGSHAWRVDYDYWEYHYGDKQNANIDCNPKPTSPAYSYETTDKLLIEVDYFFPQNSSGMIQSQIFFAAGDVSDVHNDRIPWVDLYQINFQSYDTATLRFEYSREHPELKNTFTMQKGRWNTVSTVVDLTSGMRDLYLNGELMLSNIPLYKAGLMTKISFAENNIILGKVNKLSSNESSGYFLMDNVKIMEASAPTVTPTPAGVETFASFAQYTGGSVPDGDLFPSVPAFTTACFVKNDLSNDLYLHLPLDFYDSTSGTYALYYWDGYSMSQWDWNARCQWDAVTPDARLSYEGQEHIPVYDHELGYYYIDYTYEGGSELLYLIPEKYEHLVTWEGVLRTGTPFSYAPNALLDNTVLSADYFIEEGSAGLLTSGFDTYYVYGNNYYETKADSPFSLYTVDLSSGILDASTLRFKIGEWNTVKTVLSRNTHTYAVYLNGSLALTGSLPKDFVGLGNSENAWDPAPWNVAKIDASVESFPRGGVRIDNLSTTSLPQDFPTDDYPTFLDTSLMLAKVKDGLQIVDGASIRLRSPSGLRFAATLDINTVLELFSYGDTEILDLGMLIAPQDYVDEVGAFTEEAFAAADRNYLKLPFGGFYGEFSPTDTKGTFVASITNIKQENLTRDFTAVAYLTFTYGGNTYTVYSDTVTRNVREVAEAALADQNADYTAYERRILEGFSAN